SALVDSPESGASWFDRLTFSWLNDIFRKGAVRQLGYSDLYNLSKEAAIIPNWRRYLDQHRYGRSTIAALGLSILPELLLNSVLSICRGILRFTSPFFLQRILRTIETHRPGIPGASPHGAYLDAAGLFFFTLLDTVITCQAAWLGYMLTMRIEAVLVAELSAKTLRRRGKGSWSTREDNKDTENSGSAATEGKVSNLINEDIRQIAHITDYIDDIYELPLTLGIGLWYIYQLLGVSALMGLSLAMIYVLLSKKIYDKLYLLWDRFSELSDERISMITEALQGIRAVKLFGWESRFAKNIDEKYQEQIKFSWKLRFWQSCVGVVSDISPILTFIAILFLYTIVFGNSLTAEIAFTSISVFHTVYNVLIQVSGYFTNTASIFVSVNRINTYLGEAHIQNLEARIALNSNAKLGFECISTIALDEQVNDDVFSLKNVDVQFPIGGLSIIAGPTGCGKSSLLSALVGEMTLTRGRVLLPTIDSCILAANDRKYRDVIELSNEGLAISGIAYVAQEPWLRNATIRENIIFGEPYNRDRYEAVLHACALKPDLRILKAGDMSEIGERGVTLSGGQKQRVALARAVYSNRRILLIDDCLSAVDAHTGKHILMECLLNKTSLMQGRTCVLVTHHVSMCLPFAHYVVMMHKGSIMLKGTPKELQMQGDLSDVLIELQNSDTTPSVANSDNGNNQHRPIEHIGQNSNISTLQGTLVKEEERENGHVKFEVWKLFMSICGGKLFWITLFIIIIVQEAIAALQTYWVRLWVASAANSSDNIGMVTSASLSTLSITESLISYKPMYEPISYMKFSAGIYSNSSNEVGNGMQTSGPSSMYWLGLYFVFSLLGCLWNIVMGYAAFFGGITASKSVHKQLLASVLHATPRFFDTTPIGRIINRFSSDLQVINRGAINTLISWFAKVASLITVFVVISSVIPMFISVAVVIMIVYAGVGYYYLSTLRELKRLQANSAAPVISLFSEMVNGISTIRAFNAKRYYIQETLNRVCAKNRLNYTMEASKQWFAVRMSIIGSTVSFTCILFIILNIGWMDAGLAGFVLSYATSFSNQTSWVIRGYGTNELNMNSVERVMQYMKIEQEAALESEPEHKPPALWPTKGDMQVKNLVAEYTPGVPVLHDISFSVKHGEKIGVVGRTGAGKSTLSLALLRFVEASGGRIVLDGIDISKIGLEDLRRNVTIIPQDPVLFNGTIRFNLDPFNEYPDEIVWDALRRTHLPLAVERMSGIFSSLDAEIKENGQSLSLGQRQLVALARALVRRSRLIIMDEATASVDFDTDDRIQRTIRGYEFADSTLFCIAHRLRTIIDYDRVLVLDKGRVAELDTPYNLLQNKGGIFRSMCEKSGEYEYLV
ncbi:P-loop containing nucleoside triphosphate hydrolase protein, partial [Coemansia spiralis]